MLKEKIRKLLVLFFELGQSYDAFKISIDQIKGWDSAKHVELVLFLEMELNIEYDPEDIPKLTSFDRIYETTKKYIAE